LLARKTLGVLGNDLALSAEQVEDEIPGEARML
jgi:predicted DNA repair protein MutK